MKKIGYGWVVAAVLLLVGSAAQAGEADQAAGEPCAPPAYLGVVLQPKEGGPKESTQGQTGVVIEEVMPDSPAAEAGLKASDVIRSIDGKEVTVPREVVETVHGHKPGDSVRIEYDRKGKRAEVNVTLGELERGGITWFYLREPPHVPTQPAPEVKPYDVRADLGRILERLDRIEQRLSEIEQRLERMEK